MTKTFVCCICGAECMGYGNNPYPVVEDKKAVCCDKCNVTRVIPARLKLARKTVGASEAPQGRGDAVDD